MTQHDVVDPNTPAKSGTRHGATGLITAVCLAAATHLGVPEVVAVPACGFLAGALGGLWRRYVSG